MRLTGELTINAIAWIEAILRERVCADLLLGRSSDGHLQLTMPGDERSIRFVPPIEGISPSDGFGLWDCRPDGLRPPLGKPLPTPGLTDTNRSILRNHKSRIDIEYDLIRVMYWALARIEEIDPLQCDEHGRFSARTSHAYHHGYLERPFIDEWVAVLAEIVSRLWSRAVIRRREFTVSPSHDVDFPSRYAHCRISYFCRAVGKDLILARDPRAALKGAAIRFRSNQPSLAAEDPYNTFDWIMQQSESRGYTSTFYFMCGGVHPFDPGYKLDVPALRRLMVDIHRRGHIIGLHPSYDCTDDGELVSQQADTLRRIAEEAGINQSTWGARMHYLRWQWPTMLRQFQAAGLTHDATLGYADHIGFRAGTAIPYLAFDPTLDMASGIELRPLVVMEGTLMARTYMNINEPKSCADRMLALRETCRKIGGDFALLWHNSELASDVMRQLYSTALGGVAESSDELHFSV